jgi:hypothetical protein
MNKFDCDKYLHSKYMGKPSYERNIKEAVQACINHYEGQAKQKIALIDKEIEEKNKLCTILGEEGCQGTDCGECFVISGLEKAKYILQGTKE